jgi:hypothetical protein
MKEDIEKWMKNALDSHELPYQDGAWESFEKKMNSKSKSHSNKWWISGVTIIVISIVYLLNENKTRIQLHRQNKVEIEKSISEVEAQISSSKQTVGINGKKKKENLNKLMSQKNSISGLFVNPALSLIGHELNNHSDSLVSKDINSSTNQNGIIANELKNPQANENSSEIENIPTLSDKCKNESISIDNKNSVELILRTPSGREIGIESNSKSEINLKESGIYQLGYVNSNKNEKFKEISKFNVFGTPEVHLNLDDAVTYKNGLPIINAESNSSEENVIWKVNQKVFNKTVKSTEFNLFNKGSYTITAQSKNEFGCESRDSKTIHVNEDYNLLAMSAFNPNSSDFRNNVFLPYALKERNSAFRMIVLDPDNGGVVFETTESTNPWTGIDRRDGKMVASQKAFIWKVILSNPEPGEKAEYKGTIVRVP